MRLDRPVLVSLACSLFAAAAFAGSVDDAAPVDADWWNEVQRTIAAREYELSWQESPPESEIESGWQAPNRAQGFRARFGEKGVRLEPRDPALPPWALTLMPSAFGRAGAVRTLPPVSPDAAEANTIGYRRANLHEWYENSPRGLKQGFTVAEPPTSGPGRERTRVHLEQRLGGTLVPRIAEDGRSVLFVDDQGATVVRYDELIVYDATERPLEAWFEGYVRPGERGIRIVYDDEGAVYPVTIDPLATLEAWSGDSGQAGAGYGISVGSAGDVNGDGFGDIVVGAYLYDNGQVDEGRVFVYHGSAGGPSLAANWIGEGNQAGGQYGFSVATAGDVNGDGFSDLVIGANLYAQGQSNEGLAFVHHGSSSGLSSFAFPDWSSDGDVVDAQHGYSVATAGDVNGDGFSDVIVGAPFLTDSITFRGRAQLFYGSGSGLSTSADWTATGLSAEQFGFSVTTAGDVNGDGFADVIVGSPLRSLAAGLASVFHGSAGGLPATADWEYFGTSGSRVGWSVAPAGDVDGDGRGDVVIGSPFYSNGEPLEGRALAFYGSAAGLSAAPDWTAESDEANAMFGYAVHTAGDVTGDGYSDVVVGADQFGAGGRAFVYFGSDGGLSPVEDWFRSSLFSNARFGAAVATAGDVNGDGFSDLLVGAPDGGDAFVFLGSAGGLSLTRNWERTNVAGDQFGYAIDAAGDVNGDGYGDVIVGAWLYNATILDEGGAFVFHGSATGPDTTPDWISVGGQALAHHGVSVSGAGDVNGDGYDDVIVGADQFDGTHDDEGRAQLFLGSSSGLGLTAAWSDLGGQADAHYGITVTDAGDVDGDGFADVAAGADRYDDTLVDDGQVRLFLGSDTGPSTVADWVAAGTTAGQKFGFSLGSAGDVNADGFSDLVVGSPEYDNGPLTNAGRVELFLGFSSGLSTSADWFADGSGFGERFGQAVNGAGDVNGDGFADLIVGASSYSNGQSAEGRASVYHGNSVSLSTLPAWTVESDQGSAQLGFSVDGAGDVNGDGFADVIVGVHRYDELLVDRGRALGYYGSATGLGLIRWLDVGVDAGDLYGHAVAGVGDVNGDGYADVGVGARLANTVALYYGNDGGGKSARPRQRRTDGTAPIAYLGASDSDSAFGIVFNGQTPFSRGRVKLEWEVEELATDYDGAGTETSAAWEDSGTGGGALLTELATGLDELTEYHWRARVRFDPVTSPFQLQGPWLTVPTGGRRETDLRTSSSVPIPAGSVPDGSAVPGTMLTVDKTNNPLFPFVRVSWGASCQAGDDLYALYEGTIGDFGSHEPRSCTISSLTRDIIPTGDAVYYLVVPQSDNREGAHGFDSAGDPRSTGTDPCKPQAFDGCP